MPVICGNGQANYFLRQDWTTQISLKWFSKLDFTRTWFSWRCRPAEGMRRGKMIR